MREDVNVITFVTKFPNTFRCNSVASMFDLKHGEDRVNEIRYEAPPTLEEDWSIGLIVGPSGSGKTSVAKRHYGNNVFTGNKWNAEPVLENFSKGIPLEAITKAFSSVGFNSVPSWLQSYETLSNGEKFRCDLARAILEHGQELLVFDEYTSVVDRTVAKIASNALNKYYRLQPNKAKRIIALSCHYDIVDWLAPDWVLDMRTGKVTRRRLRRPQFTIDIFQCDPSLWDIFKKYHYLTGALHRGAKCYIALINGQPAAFRATLHSMGHKNHRRGHRTVVLPEFQGIGLGTKIANFAAEYEVNHYGLSGFSMITSNLFFANGLLKSGKWKTRRHNRIGDANNRKSAEHGSASFGRAGRPRIELEYIIK